MAKKGLGRGLSALIGDNKHEELQKGEFIALLPLSKIKANVDQPRKFFDEEKLLELAESLKQFGLLQPIIVVEKNKEYEIVAGERRWRAAAMAGLQEIPCIIRQLADEQITEFSLIENIQRENLNALEEAQTYKKMQELFGYTQEELAVKLGKSRPHIANMMRLLALPPSLQAMLIDGRITAGHGRAILMLDNPVKQEMLAKKVVEQNLSVRQAENMARLLAGQAVLKCKDKKIAKTPVQILIFSDIANRLQQQLGTKVVLEKGRKGGKIVIEYYNEEDLERILEHLLPEAEF
ncbi:MAG: ParB/RepB/Spo0J family partition protein [Bacillota bacterium]|jgi:ParB family chromosome partitioning protein